jgi:predicted RNA-binding Zn ribbon-like protein
MVSRLNPMDLPPLTEQLGDKPAPPALRSVQAFLNTLDIGEGTDLLLEPATARQWLRREGMIGPRSRIDAAQLAEIRAVRESLRVLLAHNNCGPAPTAADLRPLRELAGARKPRLGVDSSGRVGLGPGTRSDVRDGLLGLLISIRDAQADGSWSRLRVCRNPDCRWAFFDRSRNRQGTWCAMAACGNRDKNRRFRARHR